MAQASDGRCLFRLFFSGELLDFFHERVDNLSFRHLANNLTPFEYKTDAFAAGDSEIGGARFARTVHFATHDRDVDIQVAVGQHALFHGFGETDEIDVSAATGGTGDKRHAFFSNS